MEAVRIENLSFKYPSCEVPALDGVDLSFNEGEFVVLCGRSGSGKTTLQTLLKPELSPKGERGGSIKLFGRDVLSLSQRESAEQIGFIRQNVEYQTVTHSVRSELAFGLENIGLSNHEITARIAESAAFFSLSDMLDERVSSLSGGQKQILSLASQCAMHPKLLILDEPAAQLDPVTAERLLNMLRKLCSEFSMTVLLAEHRLHELVPLADRLIVLEEGKAVFSGAPRNLGDIINRNAFLFHSLPLQMKLFPCENGGLPLTVSEGRAQLRRLIPSPQVTSLPEKKEKPNVANALEIKHLYYSYDEGNFVLKDLSLSVKKGGIFALLGENGSGKTTLLRLIGGILKSKRGKISFEGEGKRRSHACGPKVAMLPQKCEALFAGPTVLDDLMNALEASGLEKDEKLALIQKQAEFFEIEGILSKHPYDVSGGEMQRSALAAVMLAEPDILLLDEPTKDMDELFKKKLGEKLRLLCDCGLTVFAVCHDTEFCAAYADECALLFDGRVISRLPSDEFFSKNYFYTTTACKLSAGIFDSAVTDDQVIELCKRNL